MKLKLRYDRNQCQSCKEYFKSVAAFDRHRTGAFGVDRRCRTVEEMLGIGMAKNQRMFWVTELMGAGELERRRAAKEMADV